MWVLPCLLPVDFILVPHIPFFHWASRALMSPNLACECLAQAATFLPGREQLNRSCSVSTPTDTDPQGHAITHTDFAAHDRKIICVLL